MKDLQATAMSEEKRALQRQMQPYPDPEWRVEERIADLTDDGLPADDPNHTLWREISFYDKEGHLMRFEQWKFVSDVETLMYEGVYKYGSKTAELTYFCVADPAPVSQEYDLDDNGFLPGQNVEVMPEPYPIEATYSPDPSWKRVKHTWDASDTEKWMDISFIDASGEERRFEQWILDDAGKPSILMLECAEIVKDGKRYKWQNSGGHITEELLPDEDVVEESGGALKYIILALIVALFLAFAAIIYVGNA